MSSICPLSGLTVIEIGHSVAAPYAGMILGELGAEVIKVENPKSGDACRGWGPPFAEDGAWVPTASGTSCWFWCPRPSTRHPPVLIASPTNMR